MLERQKVEILEGTRRPVLDRSRIGVIGLALVTMALFALIVRDLFFPPAPAAASVRTATVAVGNVTSTVNATGTVEPQQQMNVNFRQAGQLAEVDVKVGDRVKKGDVLAKIDPRTLQNALSTAQASLAVAQANLQSALTPASPDQISQLQHNLANAQQAYNDTVNQVNIANAQDAAAVAADQAAVASAQNQLNTDQNALNASAQYQFDKNRLQQDSASLAAAQAKYQADGCFNSPPPNQAVCTADLAAVTQLGTAVGNDQRAIQTDMAAVTADQAALSAAQNKLNTDLSKQQVDQAANQAKLNQGTNAITSAQDQLNVQTTQKPSQVASAQASLQSSQTAVDTAQFNLDQATLLAPTDGVVLTLNGAVGESVTAGSGATPQSPGSNAPQPSTSSTSATGTAGSTSASFIVLANDTGFQAIVPFAEADAAKLKTGNAATVSFDAVPNLSVPAHVLAVAAGASVVSNVVNYLATLTIDRSDPRVKQGMTANVNVTVAQATGVLTAPNSAVTHRGQLAFVTVLGANGQQTQTLVQTGIAGDSSTEITSGVKAGDKLVLPQLRAPTSAGARTPGINLGGGGGGAGGGGGR